MYILKIISIIVLLIIAPSLIKGNSFKAKIDISFPRNWNNTDAVEGLEYPIEYRKLGMESQFLLTRGLGVKSTVMDYTESSDQDDHVSIKFNVSPSKSSKLSLEIIEKGEVLINLEVVKVAFEFKSESI